MINLLRSVGFYSVCALGLLCILSLVAMSLHAVALLLVRRAGEAKMLVEFVQWRRGRRWEPGLSGSELEKERDAALAALVEAKEEQVAIWTRETRWHATLVRQRLYGRREEERLRVALGEALDAWTRQIAGYNPCNDKASMDLFRSQIASIYALRQVMTPLPIEAGPVSEHVTPGA